jgi:hypothetical protein
MRCCSMVRDLFVEWEEAASTFVEYVSPKTSPMLEMMLNENKVARLHLSGIVAV